VITARDFFYQKLTINRQLLAISHSLTGSSTLV
jgi:hypothetical protein